MAEIILFEAGSTFILKMSEEDMETLTVICTQKKTNYFDTVVACFHAGLVMMAKHSMKHLNSGDTDGIEEKNNKS